IAGRGDATAVRIDLLVGRDDGGALVVDPHFDLAASAHALAVGGRIADQDLGLVVDAAGLAQLRHGWRCAAITVVEFAAATAAAAGPAAAAARAGQRAARIGMAGPRTGTAGTGAGTHEA